MDGLEFLNADAWTPGCLILKRTQSSLARWASLLPWLFKLYCFRLVNKKAKVVSLKESRSEFLGMSRRGEVSERTYVESHTARPPVDRTKGP